MSYHKMNVYIKFFNLVAPFTLLFFINEYQEIIKVLVFVFFFAAVTRTNIFKYYKFLTFGLIISLFTFGFELIVWKSYNVAFYAALMIFLKYVYIYVLSIIYKENTSLREASYVLAKIVRIFGGNPKKTYILIMLIGNTINQLRQNVELMYRINSIEKKASYKGKITCYINLIKAFFDKVFLLNNELALTLINKKVDFENKQLVIYYEYKNNYLLLALIYGFFLFLFLI